MRSHALFQPIITKFCVWSRVSDFITDAKFYGNRQRGFGITGPQTPFPMLNVHRPYNHRCDKRQKIIINVNKRVY